MFSNFGKRALGLQVIGIVALQACSPGGHSPGEGNVESITSALGVSPGIWRPEGPAPITSCGTSLPFSDCSGAAQQAVVDPTSGAIYLATINGGVFKSTTTTANTIFSNPPSRMQWTPLTDDRPSLSMSALAIDPSNPQSLIAGTGQYSSFGAVGAQGVVYVLANGGATVTTVDDPLLRGQRISALTIRGNLALATTDGNSGGVFCSEDGGLSWSSLLGSQGLPSNIGPAWDLTADPSNANRYYVVVGDQGTGNAGIYLGTHSGSTCKNGGFAWAQISNSDQSARGLQFK